MHIFPTQVLALRRYIEGIRNPRKRAYATQYQAYLRGAAEMPIPIGLSYMGAQAVRLRIREILGE